MSQAIEVIVRLYDEKDGEEFQKGYICFPNVPAGKYTVTTSIITEYGSIGNHDTVTIHEDMDEEG